MFCVGVAVAGSCQMLEHSILTKFSVFSIFAKYRVQRIIEKYGCKQCMTKAGKQGRWLRLIYFLYCNTLFIDMYVRSIFMYLYGYAYICMYVIVCINLYVFVIT